MNKGNNFFKIVTVCVDVYMSNCLKGYLSMEIGSIIMSHEMVQVLEIVIKLLFALNSMHG